MKKWFRRFGIFLLLILVLIFIWGYVQFQDRNPGYTLDLNIKASVAAELQAGFAKTNITPLIEDRWQDVDENAKYEPGKGDTFEDLNGNGEFDAYWIAGFSQKRAANGVHDSLWARAMIIDDGATRMAIVSLDAIGFGHDDVIAVRNRVPDRLKVSYISITSTHTHEAPDLLGLWGPGTFSNGINRDYQEWVYDQAAAAIITAVEQMKPAYLRVGRDLNAAKELVTDSRRPYVLDPGIRTIQAIDKETEKTLGTLVSWANHPETLWSKNLLLTSDFPHYVREGVESGIYDGDSLIMPGLGGIAVYVNGSIGGLMTTDPDFSIKHPFRDTSYLEPTFEKAWAQGTRLAMLALHTLDSTATIIDRGSISLRAKTILLPLDNSLFRLATFMGVLNRGTTGWMKVRSEVAIWQLGPISCLLVPGEIYPEIINGGVEAPAGQDFAIPPSEAVPLRELMPGTYKFVMGLANDEIGYIIPKSEWDEDSPYLYEADKSPYGEINSLGPETAPVLYLNLKEVIQSLSQSEY